MIKALYPVFCQDKGATHACYALLSAMRNEAFPVEYWSPQFAAHLNDGFLRPGMPRPLFRLLCRLNLYRKPLVSTWAIRHLEKRYLNGFHDGDIAYLWPAVSVELYRSVKQRGITIVAERINCHRKTSLRVLREAYEKLGWPPKHGIKEADVTVESEKMALADYVFAPSNNVAASLVDAGVPEAKVLQSSYGWEPRRFRFQDKAVSNPDCPTFLFVGRGCVRKGVPWLLKMWERAGIQGRLLLFLLGDMECAVSEHYSEYLNRSDVIIPQDTTDINEAYRKADVFIFPTHEEGSPLVSYEALGWGLPSLVSPMGGGAIVRDGVEGYVMDPYDVDLWAERIHTIARDRELRENMARAARARAEEFTWDRVGLRRRAQFLNIMRK
ncbi:MAG TPA: glycosyltransferase [Candidatus Hydrogenedentes bacterium]|nr:glycosyltransferase [Candidatus Hydrogenedentota bacterium]